VDGEISNYTLDTYKELGNRDMSMDYQLNTPWTFNGSLGYTFGSSVALGAEYEYKDYASTRFYDSGGIGMDFENEEASKYGGLKGVHTFRAGIEYKPIPEFAFRAGYNYSTAAFEEYAIKNLPLNSIHTDTDFTNKYAQSNYTFGIGYKGKSFYADITYKYATQKADFYPFVYLDNDQWVSPEAAKVTDNRSQVLLTLGYRF
jgi:opacity protein-like surface antigen